MSSFKGFEDSRYLQHDSTIQTIVKEYNADKATFIGAEAEQVKNIPDLDWKLVRSWLIQESGGNDSGSLAAWKVDPAQVNVPGDWSEYKKSAGLTQPSKRNEGNLKTNVKAAIVWMVRKGFGKSGQPPKNRPTASFDGYQKALERYNGRSVVRSNGKAYRVNYAQRIMGRYKKPATHHEIELPK